MKRGAHDKTVVSPLHTVNSANQRLPAAGPESGMPHENTATRYASPSSQYLNGPVEDINTDMW